MISKTKKQKNKVSTKIVKKLMKLKKSSSKIAKKAIVISKTTTKLKNKQQEKNKVKLKNANKPTPTLKSKEIIKTKNAPNKLSLKVNSPKKLKPAKTTVYKNVKKISLNKQVDIEHQKHNQDFIEHQYLSASPIISGPGKFQPYEINNSEEYMSNQQLQHFANILEAWKQELMLEVDHTITEMKEADILADPNDRATQEETFNLELRTRDRERKLIKKIESALNKISEEKYGYCDSCGVEIGIRRLEARPTATLCIECKTLAEIREKRS